MTNPTPQPPRRLTRSRDDRVIAGVCGGLARYLNVDASLVRISAVVLTVLVSGLPVLLYLVAVFVVPEDDGVGLGRPTPPRQPDWPPATPPSPPTDPVWGREGAPWEQPEPRTDPPAGPTPDGGSSDPQRPDAR
nr:PspC domain-containing protein [uncultured Friedmanniella sp.]